MKSSKTNNNKALGISRRDALKFVGAGVGVGVLAASAGCASSMSTTQSDSPVNIPVKLATNTQDPWHKTHDRVWLGGEFWANPMEDWQVKGGHAHCINPG